MSETVVKITKLVKRYKELIALDNFSLEIKEGEIFGLLGPSGAGKTTLIKILTGQLGYDEGSVRILEKDVEELRKLVEPAGSDEFSDRSDPVVVFGRKTRNAVLLRVNSH